VEVSRAPSGRASLAYHGTRIASYAGIGALLALAGDGVKRALGEIAPVLPWLMAAALVVSALGLGRVLPAPAFLKNLLGRVARKSANFSPLARAAALGMATPLLPCAALYAVLLAAAATGKSLAGALLMAGFALGATPALALVQSHAPLLRRHPRLALAAGRAFPLLAAAVLVWRALHAGAPSCH
jgi:sulfite exporter TauE/SafE